MNRTETVLLCRYVKAMCPAQAVDEYTPDAWADVLDDITLEDAKAAIREGIRDREWRFIDVTDVVAGVRSKRTERLNAYFRTHGHPVPPPALDEKPREAARWLAAAQERIAGGEVTHPEQLDGFRVATDLQVRVLAELGQVGQRVPSAPRETHDTNKETTP